MKIRASSGLVRRASFSSTATCSSIPASRPSSASTVTPTAWAASTTRLVSRTFVSKSSWDLSIMTLVKPSLRALRTLS